ncbi:MAG: NAD-dependent epimerase/dehydratase family protein [Candidatus Omnitrophica bacterium]|nr:NAD-dependent epimerase/dehydratase family protein [Candidatus Omnitrophota bacterium]
MNNQILILGGGFIGKRLHQEWGCPLSEKRISSYADIQKEIEKYRPKVLVNCIGHVGINNVDDCELDIDKTLTANTFLPTWLGEIAFRNNIKLVHISSGCIYNYTYGKQKPIAETRMPDYYTLFYSRTKIYAEQILNTLSKKCNILTIRIRVPLDIYPDKRNLLTKLINYKKVIDTPNSATYIPDFVKALKHLIRIDAQGIYNVTCRGGLRYPELMRAYKQVVPDFQYEVIRLKQLKLNRTNLILSVDKLAKSGFPVRNIKEVLKECVAQYVKY